MEVSRYGSINKASRVLFVSQSAVSSAIKELENEFSIRLLERTSRGAQLTADGREFISYARPLLEQKEKMESLFVKENITHLSRLSISTQRYPFAVEAFLQFFQSVQAERYEYRIKETGMYRVIQDVGDNESDVGVIFLSNVTEQFIRKVLQAGNIEFNELCKIRPHAFIRKSHPLAGQGSIHTSQLRGFPYMAFDQDYGASLDYGEEVRLFSFHKPPKMIFVHDRATAYNVLANTDAFTLGSGLLVKGLVDSRLCSLPLDDVYDRMRLGWIKLKSRTLSEEALDWIAKLEETIRKHVAEVPFLVEE